MFGQQTVRIGGRDSVYKFLVKQKNESVNQFSSKVLTQSLLSFIFPNVKKKKKNKGGFIAT